MLNLFHVSFGVFDFRLLDFSGLRVLFERSVISAHSIS